MPIMIQGETDFYEIEWSATEERYTCSCPDYIYRKSKENLGKCKHILKALEEGKLVEYNRPTNLDSRYKSRIYFEETISLLREMLEDISYKWMICGSYRRNKELIKDLDVVVWIKEKYLCELRERISLKGYVDSGKDKRIIAKFRNPGSEEQIQVDFRIIENPIYWGSMIAYFTGSKKENIRLRSKALSLGLSLNEYGIYSKSGEWLGGKEEQDIYSLLGEDYKEPEER